MKYFLRTCKDVHDTAMRACSAVWPEPVADNTGDPNRHCPLQEKFEMLDKLEYHYI